MPPWARAARPGLASRAPASGSGSGSGASRPRGGDRERWELRPLSQSGRGTGLAALMQGGRGQPGKHVRAARGNRASSLRKPAWERTAGTGPAGGKGAAEPVDDPQMGLKRPAGAELTEEMEFRVPDLKNGGPGTAKHGGCRDPGAASQMQPLGTRGPGQQTVWTPGFPPCCVTF